MAAAAAVALPPSPLGGGEHAWWTRPSTFRRRGGAASAAAPAPAARAAAPPLPTPAAPPAASALAASLTGGRPAAARFCASLCCLLAVAVALGAAPWLGAPLFALFAATALPARAVAFARRGWAFFLADFCYAANALVAGVLVAAAVGTPVPRWERAAAALADGPLAGALLAWQCAFGPSLDHNVSVLLHALPGLALFARRWHGASVPASAPSLVAALAAAPPPGPASLPSKFSDRLLLPLLFYGGWQALYFLVVHLIFSPLILARRYDTSYRTLARRAAVTNNIWNRIVRRGPAWRRVGMYGTLQAGFTAAWLVAALPLPDCYPLAAAWQAAKVAVPLWYGCLHVLVRSPRRAVGKALEDGRLGVPPG